MESMATLSRIKAPIVCAMVLAFFVAGAYEHGNTEGGVDTFYVAKLKDGQKLKTELQQGECGHFLVW